MNAQLKPMANGLSPQRVGRITGSRVAAVLWGVGRYLYDLPTPWVEIDQYGKWKADPALPAAATPAGYLAKLKAETEKRAA